MEIKHQLQEYPICKNLCRNRNSGQAEEQGSLLHLHHQWAQNGALGPTFYLLNYNSVGLATWDSLEPRYHYL